MKDKDYDKEWQKKVTEWRSNMQELGDFKHRNETFNQIRTAGTNSVFNCLQSLIENRKIVLQI